MQLFNVAIQGSRRTHGLIGVGAAVAAVAFFCAPALAQEEATEGQKGLDEKSHPLGGPGLKVDAGYRRLFGEKEDSTYLHVDLLGKTLTNQGKAFTDIQGFKGFPQFHNDTPQLRLAIERGVAQTDGPLANYLQLGKLPRFEGLRVLVAGYGTLEQSSSLGFSAGVETIPFFLRIPKVPNFAAIGLQFGTQPVTRGTGDDERTVQRDVGVFAYRQFTAYNPLDRYSDFRTHVLAFANALPDSAPVSIADFYRGVLSGDVSVLSSLATDEAAGKALDALSDEERKTLVQDLRYGAVFTVSEIRQSAPATVGADIRRQLANPPAGSTLAVLKQEFGILAAVDPAITGWTQDDAKTLLVAERFVTGGGPALQTSAGEAKKYITNTLKPPLTPGITVANQLIDLAFEDGQSASQRIAMLTVANRLLLEAIFPQVATYGTTVTGVKKTLQNMYVHKDRSSFVLLMENTGHYYLAGDDGNGMRSRLNHLFAATGTYYFNPGAGQRNFLRLRYESGRNRADPKPYNNQLTATLGFEL